MDYIYDIRPNRDLPYTNLIAQYTAADHAASFREPENPSQKSGSGTREPTSEEQSIEQYIKSRFGSFGSVSHSFRRGSPGEYYYAVHYRKDRGSLEHGLGRNDEEFYECAKYNTLRHPRAAGCNNPEYGLKKPGDLSEPDKRMLELNGYPYIDSGTIMRAS